MSEDKLSIINDALAMIGVAAITSDELTNPDVNPARLATKLYDSSIDKLLRVWPWKFAQRRAALTFIAAQTVGVGNRFALPDGTETPPLLYCLRVLEVLTSDNDWTVEGRELITLDTTASILYVGRQNDTTQWDPIFLEAFTHFLSFHLCYPLTRDLNMRKEVYSYFLQDLEEAKGKDRREEKDTTGEVSPNPAALDINILSNVRIPGTGVLSGPASGF